MKLFKIILPIIMLLAEISASGRTVVIEQVVLKMENQKETWKDIPKYEGLYQASNTGNIKSLHKVVLRNGMPLVKKERILKLVSQKDFYTHVTLCKDGIKKQFPSHVLTAITFISNPENKPCVNHINAVKNDNRIENLEWVTHKENTQHAYKNGLMRSPKHWTGKFGEKHPKSKKLIVIDRENGEEKLFFGTSEASRLLNVSQAYISQCCRNKRSHKKYIFIYE